MKPLIGSVCGSDMLALRYKVDNFLDTDVVVAFLDGFVVKI